MAQNQHAWTRDEVEELIGWMEDNVDVVQGRQSTWHKDVKAEVFADNEGITVKNIKDKLSNMKALWRKARALQNSPGWGIRPERGERSIRQVLERECPFYERLDEIWGTLPPERTAIFPSVDSWSLRKPTGRGSAAAAAQPPRAPRTPQQPTPTPQPVSTPAPRSSNRVDPPSRGSKKRDRNSMLANSLEDSEGTQAKQAKIMTKKPASVGRVTRGKRAEIGAASANDSGGASGGTSGGASA